MDDNASVRHNLATGLSSVMMRAATCVQVDRAANAIEACAKEKFDAVFLSLTLADGEKGLDLLQQLSERWPALKVVVHTSRPEADREVREAMSRGACAYLAKPLRANDLKKVMFELDRGFAGAGTIA